MAANRVDENALDAANWSNSCGLIVAADGQGQCLVIAQQNAYEHWNGKSINAAIEI